MFQSTHPRRVWQKRKQGRFASAQFQSTHPRRVWPVYGSLRSIVMRVSIHTPTKGVTIWRLWYDISHWCFNPHTHEGCDSISTTTRCDIRSFNPHTHEGCDSKWIHNQPDSSKFQSTHPRRVWLRLLSFYPLVWKVSIHTPTKGVTIDAQLVSGSAPVSIHTPTKGVTKMFIWIDLRNMFQSTHPRRVWHIMVSMQFMMTGFNPHTHEGCDGLSFILC